MPRTHRPYPPEFRAEAVRLARGSDKSIPALAADLGVSSEALRHWLRRADADVSARAQADAALAAQIAAVHARSRRTYGAPRIHAALRAQGTRCARKRVARLMRAAGLVGCHRRRRARTTGA